MMNKKKTCVLQSAKYLLAIPLGIALLLGNALRATPELLSQPISNIVNADNKSDQTKQASVKDDIPQKKGDVYLSVDEKPQYPGGDDEMFKFIKENLKYPESAENGKIEGVVVARFIVKSKGEISNVEVIKSLNPECDEEVVRVISAMPDWTPGKQKGTAVDVYFTLPVAFKLKKDQ